MDPNPPHVPVLPKGVKLGKTKVSAVIGDILDQPVEAIVNAANETLSGGGGVDGAIHRAAGADLAAHCATLPLIDGHGNHRIQVGDAVVTPSFKIAERQPLIQYVVHTVGPRSETPNREKLLANAYYNSLLVAHEKGIRSIAFPAISVGIFGYPFQEAQEIAFATVKKYVDENPAAFDAINFVYLRSNMTLSWEESVHAAWQKKVIP